MERGLLGRVPLETITKPTDQEFLHYLNIMRWPSQLSSFRVGGLDVAVADVDVADTDEQSLFPSFPAIAELFRETSNPT